MTEDRTTFIGRLTARFAAMIIGAVLALAIGAPWLLHDAPPSPEAVLASSVCCTSAAGATDSTHAP